LDTAFRAFEEWGEGVYPMIKQPCDSVEKHKPRDFNLLVVNEYNYESKPDSYIPWHDDKMDQSITNDEDAILTLVISMSLGDAAVFAVMPNREARSFLRTCAMVGVRRSGAVTNRSSGAALRFCCTTVISS